MPYLRRFLATLFGLLGLVAAVDALIDPYGVLGTPPIARLSQVKSPAPDRFFKPLQVSARQPKTVLIGSSRVLEGLDPRDVPGGDAYNLGIPASTMAENAALVLHALADTPVERIVIGLDYQSFIAPFDYYPSFRLAILGRFAFWRGLPDLLISQRALVRTNHAVQLSRRGASPAYQPDGLRLTPDEPLAARPPAARILRTVAEYVIASRHIVPAARSLTKLDALLAGLPPRVAILVFITPAHAALRETLELTGQGAAYQAWLRAVTEICAAHGAKLWDFGGYNRITTQPLDGTSDDYYDASHFRPPIGRLVLDTLLRGIAAPDFGVRLTPDTLPAYLAAQQAARQAWRDRLPDDVRSIAETVAAARR
jgi:hypothetical protein